VVAGGCPHPTGWWGHPNHRRLPREVPGIRDPTTARDIQCLRGMREARGRSPPRHHCTPAPRATTHRARLVRRAVLRAAPRAPGLASRELIYSDPDLWLDWATIQFRFYQPASRYTGSFYVFGPALSSPAHAPIPLDMRQIEIEIF
jgi:hypothetical protein